MANAAAAAAADSSQQPTTIPTPTQLLGPTLRCICALCECGNHSCATTPEPTGAGLKGFDHSSECGALCERYLTSEAQYNGQITDLLAGAAIDDNYADVDALDRSRTAAHGDADDDEADDGDNQGAGDARSSRVRQSRQERERKHRTRDAVDDDVDGGDRDAVDRSRLSSSSLTRRQQQQQQCRWIDADDNKDLNDDEQQPAGDRLLHVLVTKPEIASKPRDNIVFEGDMDLRTTFETSYEALAKMRLDHWRRYQQQQQQRLATARSASVSPEAGAPLKEAAGSSRAAAKQTPASDVSRNNNLLYSSSTSSLSRLATGDWQQQRSADQPPEQQSPVPAAGPAAAAAPKHAGARARPVRSPSSGSRRLGRSNDGGEIDDDTTCAGVDATADDGLYGAAGATTAQSRSRARQRAAAATQTPTGFGEAAGAGADGGGSAAGAYIDQDLSPIIVYDANLNRLERVGQRRRSKYRPSTSLRPGAGGFFGDAAPGGESDAQVATSVAAAARQQVDAHDRRPLVDQQYRSPVGQDEERVAGIATERSSSRAAAAAQSPVNVNGTSGATDLWDDKGRTQRSTPVMGDRNMKNAYQNDGLVYSASNLRIDSKRRLRDNINMTDHIKDQNIVEAAPPIYGSGRPHQQDQKLAVGFDDHDAVVDGGTQSRGHLTSLRSHHTGADPNLPPASYVPTVDENDNTMLLKQLAEQEERAAVEEIQRATGAGDEDASTGNYFEEKGKPKFGKQSPRTPRPGGKRTASSSRASRASGRDTDDKQVVAAGRQSGVSNGAGSRSDHRAASRLQRTCQHQNFDIFTNEYPKTNEFNKDLYKQASSTTKTTTPKGKPRTGAGMVKSSTCMNNLFRESPDFILTTGTGGSAARRAPSRQPKAAASHRTDASNVPNKQQQQEMREEFDFRRRQAKCRVLYLDREFDYVGSRSGHRYYAEKFD